MKLFSNSLKNRSKFSISAHIARTTTNLTVFQGGSVSYTEKFLAHWIIQSLATMPIKCANTPKHRRRTSSGSILSPRKELLRSCIRLHVASEPYDTLTREDTWHEALRLAKSLEEKPQVIRKAIYSRRSFVNKKIKDLLIHHHVLNPYSPIIAAIARKVQTIESNVIYILEMQLGRSDVFDEVVVSTNTVKANGTKMVGKEKEKKTTA